MLHAWSGRSLLLGFCCAFILTARVPAQAETVISTIAAWDHLEGYGYGTGDQPVITRMGQTFTTPPESTLTRAQFIFAANFSGTSKREFWLTLSAWDGSTTVGSPLYTGPRFDATLVKGPFGAATPFTFETGGLTLTPLQQYIAYVSFDGPSYSWDMAGRYTDLYAGGGFYHSSAIKPQWQQSDVGDAAFAITFVPEPSGFLAVTAVLSLLSLPRRTRRPDGL